MGVLQRFEHRLEGMVEGAFARAFKSELQPVEVASAIQREMDDRAAIVAQGRTLVPNDFVVEVAEDDYARLDVYADSLGIELATLAREYAKEQGYSFVGPVRMRFEGVRDLTTGTFRILSGVIRGTTVEDGEIRRPASDLPQPAGGFHGNPRLLVSGPEPGPDGSTQRTYEISTPLIILGRGHRLRPAARRPWRLPPPRRDPGRGRRGRARRPRLHQRDVRQRPARPASHAERRHPGDPRPDDPGLPQGQHLLSRLQYKYHSRGRERGYGLAPPAARPGQPNHGNGQPRTHDPMNALELTLVRIGFLAVLWLFVIAAVGVVRTDLFGPASQRRKRPRRAAPAGRAQARAPEVQAGPDVARRRPQQLLVTAGIARRHDARPD